MAENGPNGFTMPNNLAIDTKITFLECSEPKLRVWPLYGHLSGHFGLFGQSEVAENGPNEFPMPKNLGIDTKIAILACSEPI